MPLPKAILFDLDDTILSLDSSIETSWETACRSFIEQRGVQLDFQAFHGKVTEKRKWFWADPERHKAGRADLTGARTLIVRLAMRDLGFDDEAGARRLVDEYTLLQENATHLFDGADEALEIFRGLGIRMGLITNGTSERQRGKVNRFNLSHFFELILIEEEAGVGKPDLRIFEIALEKLSLPASDVWMVGDNLAWEIEAPQKLGIYAVWNDFRNGGLPDGAGVRPDKIISSIYDLAIELMNNAPLAAALP